jgi:hypothetical protein
VSPGVNGRYVCFIRAPMLHYMSLGIAKTLSRRVKGSNKPYAENLWLCIFMYKIFTSMIYAFKYIWIVLGIMLTLFQNKLVILIKNSNGCNTYPLCKNQWHFWLPKFKVYVLLHKAHYITSSMIIYLLSRRLTHLLFHL